MNVKYFRQNWKSIDDTIYFTEDEWKEISKYQKLNEDFIKKYEDRVIWHYISGHQILSEKLIEKYKDRVNWVCISMFQKLSEKFIYKYRDRVYWDLISEYQILSEELIEKYKDRVDWYFISKYQELSNSFIYRYRDRIYYCNHIRKILNERYIIENRTINYIYYSKLMLYWNEHGGFNIDNKSYSIILSEII
jgi:hypothetical protein